MLQKYFFYNPKALYFHRSGWQKRVDAHLRKKTGRSKIKSISPVQLLTVSLNGHGKGKEPEDLSHPDYFTQVSDVSILAHIHNTIFQSLTSITG